MNSEHYALMVCKIHTCTNFSISLAGLTVEWPEPSKIPREPPITVFPDNSQKRMLHVSSKTILLNRRIPMHLYRIICKHTGYLSQFSTSVKQLECWKTVLYLPSHVSMGIPLYEFVLNHLRRRVWYLLQISRCHEVQ